MSACLSYVVGTGGTSGFGVWPRTLGLQRFAMPSIYFLFPGSPLLTRRPKVALSMATADGREPRLYNRIAAPASWRAFPSFFFFIHHQFQSSHSFRLRVFSFSSFFFFNLTFFYHFASTPYREPASPFYYLREQLDFTKQSDYPRFLQLVNLRSIDRTFFCRDPSRRRPNSYTKKSSLNRSLHFFFFFFNFTTFYPRRRPTFYTHIL
jgi:hypothetical protein